MIFNPKKYRKSFINGVSFYTKSSTISGGQRLTEHFFIGGGVEAETNGANNNSFDIEAYVVGSTYQIARDRLKKELDKIGTVSFIDKFFGSHQVYVSSYTVNEDTSKIGVAKFNITLKKALHLVEIKSSANFSFSLFNSLADVFKNTINLNIDLNSFNTFIAQVKSYMDEVSTLIGTIEAEIEIKKESIRQLFNVVDSLKDKNLDGVVSSVFNVFNVKTATKTHPLAITGSSKDYINLTSLSLPQKGEEFNLFKLFFETAMVDHLATNISNVSFNTSNNFGEAKENILAKYNSILEQVDDITLYDLIAQQKKEFIQVCTQTFSTLQSLQIEDISEINAFSLVMNKYKTIDRVGEILENNGLIDPLFISGKVLLLPR